jgi:hypothetical protein
MAHVKLRKMSWEDLKFHVSLGYIARLCVKNRITRHWWLTSVILATWEAEIRRIMFPGQSRPKKK